jgi:type VI secretion system protein ImpC
MIYEAEYGTYGGFPYSLLVGGYAVGRSAADMDFLHNIAAVAAAAHAPFITAASAALFGMNSFGDLAKPRELQKIFEGSDWAGWQAFRDSEDSRYVSLVLPHALLRLPYGKNSDPVEGMNFEEAVGLSASSPDSNCFLWGNAAYLLAQRITHAFSLYRWTAAIRGVEGGGLVEGLPIYRYRTDAGAEARVGPADVSITDQRAKALTELGFAPLCDGAMNGQAAFFGGQTSHPPKKDHEDSANTNAKISAMLPYMLAASRFAHYIKVTMRSKIGSFMTRGNVEAYLNTWIANYVLLDDNASQKAKASFPLRQASVVVTDVPGEPGVYSAVLFIRPHFQLEELTTSIRLVINLPT